jgi:hypothetical protein
VSTCLVRKSEYCLNCSQHNFYESTHYDHAKEAWLSCAKEYELKLMEKDERINELIMADMTHEYNQAEAENFRHEYERQLLEPLQEKVKLLREAILENINPHDLPHSAKENIEQALKQTE